MVEFIVTREILTMSDITELLPGVSPGLTYSCLTDALYAFCLLVCIVVTCCYCTLRQCLYRAVP